MSKKPFVVGHRGASGLAPENTLPALEAGIAAGANLVEVDVQRTTDGVLIIFHDDSLERLTNGKGVVAQKSLAELKALDAGSHFSPQYAGTTLPTLDEALALVMSKGKHLVIEAKSPADFPGMET
ncbi:MAG: glycerophosphodiester phosphodiesterase, partial [Anaerolineae bacterium]